MKRHGFHGVSSSHGSHRNHRKPGSIGGCSTPGRVFKGMRMAGRMGVDKQTTQSLRIVKVDTERGLLLIEGAVPGPKGGLVLVRPRSIRREGGLSAMTLTIEVVNPADSTRKKRTVELPAEIFDVPDQHRADPPGRGGPARRRPPGHRFYQDPRRGSRWWQEALPAEGHRPRPSGFHPRPAVRRRWRGARPAAAQATTSAPRRR